MHRPFVLYCGFLLGSSPPLQHVSWLDLFSPSTPASLSDSPAFPSILLPHRSLRVSLPLPSPPTASPRLFKSALFLTWTSRSLFRQMLNYLTPIRNTHVPAQIFRYDFSKHLLFLLWTRLFTLPWETSLGSRQKPNSYFFSRLSLTFQVCKNDKES